LQSALKEFPIVGTQLATPQGLQGSTPAVIVGTLAAVYGVIGAELNSVLAHRLYPRSLLALFTDSATDLTPADHRAYAMYAQAQRHKTAETIEVTFDPHEPVDPIAQTPQAPEHQRGERPPGKSS
jgi:hypothetical protein